MGVCKLGNNPPLPSETAEGPGKTRRGEGKRSERITSGKGDEGMVYGMDPGENFGEFVRTQLPVGAISLLVQCLGEAGTGFLYLGVLSTSFC